MATLKRIGCTIIAQDDNKTLVQLVEENKRNLHGADLRRADLRHADLRRVDLRHADLRCANLRYADLRCANLRHADLRHADLHGALISDNYRLKDTYHHVTNIGSENGVLELYDCEEGWFIRRGCFSGSKAEFLAKVTETHGDHEHAQKYRQLIAALIGDDI